MEYRHIPVLLKETLDCLSPTKGQRFIDGTLGGASYTLALAKAVGPTGKILSLDLDPMAIDNAEKRISEIGLENIKLVESNFKNIIEVVRNNFPPDSQFDGIVADLGLSSAQLDDENRGLSFAPGRPLDMSFGSNPVIPTEKIVNTYPAERLEELFRDSGAGSWSGDLARRIVQTRSFRPLKKTDELLDLIKQSLPNPSRSSSDPATVIFQSLRMETNGEKEALKKFLSASVKLLKLGGILALVSFHSGEDRIIKDFFKDNKIWESITPRPIVAGQAELNANPRSRSAKLRAAKLINNFNL